MAAVRKRRQLTAYGRWVKLMAIEKNISMNELASTIGTTPERISEIVYGVIPGNKYRSQIEKALGAVPPADIAS